MKRSNGFKVAALMLATVAVLAVVPQVQADDSHAARPRCPMAAPAANEPLEPLDGRVQAAIADALQDERQSEAQYARFGRELGGRRPFSNTVRAEGRHAQFLEQLLQARQLPVPAMDGAIATQAAASPKEACAASIEAEKRNVAIYDRLLAAGPLPEDVKRVFEHNRWASQEHHLPAFQRCAGVAGEASGVGGRGPGRGRGFGRGRGPGGGHGCGGCAQGCAAPAADGAAK